MDDPPPLPQQMPPQQVIAPVDPNLALQADRANAANIANLTQQAQGDTASLMARYGTRLALAGVSSGSPLIAPAPAPAAAASPTAPATGSWVWDTILKDNPNVLASLGAPGK